MHDVDIIFRHLPPLSHLHQVLPGAEALQPGRMSPNQCIWGGSAKRMLWDGASSQEQRGDSWLSSSIKPVFLDYSKEVLHNIWGEKSSGHTASFCCSSSGLQRIFKVLNASLGLLASLNDWIALIQKGAPHGCLSLSNSAMKSFNIGYDLCTV